MTYLRVLIICFFIVSCSSTKQTTENIPKNISKENRSKTIVTKDSPHKTTPTLNLKTGAPQQKKNQLEYKNITETFNHTKWHDLLQKHVSNDGHVNYKSFKTDRKPLLLYIKSLGDRIPQDSWTKTDKLAYWINAYNAMTIDLILRHYPIKSIKDIQKPWEQRLWKLGEKWYNLNEIEHRILRKMNEPRIHFAIVCASFSCPKLQNEAYTSPQLNAQLTQATKLFLADKNRNEISKNHIKLSKIFQWFSKDFKQKESSLIDFLNKYSEITISNKAKQHFKTYNWDLNE